MRTFELGLFSVALMALVACGGTPTTSGDSEDDSSNGSESGSPSGDVEVPASAATQNGVGVDRWEVSKAGVVGYEAARAAVKFRYTDTQVSADTTHTSVDLDDGTAVAHYEFDVQHRADGAFRVTAIERNEPNGESALRTLQLLGADLTESLKKGGLATESLRALDLTKGGGMPLTAGCWNEEIVHANGHVYILTTTQGPNGTWNTSVTCAR